MEILKQIFKPTGIKIILDIILVAAYLAVVFFLPALGMVQKFAGFNLLQLSLSLALSFLIVALVYYPLVCGLVGVFNFWARPNNAGGLIVSVLLVLIFNPLTFHQAAKLLSAYNQAAAPDFSIGMDNRLPAKDISTGNCGMEIISFFEFSKAKNSGLKVNDVVTEVDGVKINSANDIMKNSQAKRPGDLTALTTARGIFKVELVSDPVNHGPVLGIRFNDAKCPVNINDR